LTGGLIGISLIWEGLMTPFITVKETCSLLKISRQTVYEWMRSGKLKAVKAGRLVRIRREDLESFLKEWRPGKKR
jgi:excisionase family DNA binding protein